MRARSSATEPSGESPRGSCSESRAEDILGSSFLYHNDWNDGTKATAAAIEVAGLTGLAPKDIRPIIKDGKTNELLLVDSGSCKCLEPASPGLRANGTNGPG